jgi:hypothetical protein
MFDPSPMSLAYGPQSVLGAESTRTPHGRAWYGDPGWVRVLGLPPEREGADWFHVRGALGVRGALPVFYLIQVGIAPDGTAVHIVEVPPGNYDMTLDGYSPGAQGHYGSYDLVVKSGEVTTVRRDPATGRLGVVPGSVRVRPAGSVEEDSPGSSIFWAVVTAGALGLVGWIAYKVGS